MPNVNELNPEGFPDGKRFAFTIFDDTDGATVENVKPVYDLLSTLGLKTTKSVWVYPPRGRFRGQCLLDDEYLNFVHHLQAEGFEIGLHNVGDGAFTRQEILDGVDTFIRITGHPPMTHTNHVSNPDNIHWFGERFEWPINLLYTLWYLAVRRRAPTAAGSDLSSSHFWGDRFKECVKYTRNLTFNDINTLLVDPLMPYRVDSKPYANYWFSSSDGHTVTEMIDLLSPENCDRLESERGACVVYTHFASGYVSSSGQVHPEFERRLRYLASKRGWFVPVKSLLDHLLETHGGGDDPGYMYRLTLNLRWALNRAHKRIRSGR